MKAIFRIAISMAILCLTLTTAGAADDLKEFYEQQKAVFLPQFKAPELGSQVCVQLIGGKERTGILMDIGTSTIDLMLDDGSSVKYKRLALHESSRTLFFAEDYAHVNAFEKTREQKARQDLAEKAAAEADIHDATLTVIAKLDKNYDKKEENEQRENKKTKKTTTIDTITKIYSEIQTLNVTVANTTSHADTYTLEWYFFGEAVRKNAPEKKPKKPDDKNKEKPKKEKPEPLESGIITLEDQGTQKVTVDSLDRKILTLTSKPFEVTKISRAYNGNINQHNPPPETGKESAGYLVILKYGPRVLDKKASARAYLAEDWLKKFE